MIVPRQALAEAAPSSPSEAPAPPPMPLRFNGSELSGSLGDLGTFLPLAVALSVVCGMDLGLILVLAGVMHAVSGWVFRQPVPVQPMKAIAAVAITEGLLPGEIAAAGLWMGAFMVLLAGSGAVDAAVRRVPRPIVRGIQAGVGLKLALQGFGWLTGVDLAATSTGPGLPWLGWDSLAVALAAGAALAWPARRVPMLLIVFAGGLGLLFLAQPGLWSELRFAPPALTVLWPDGAAWSTGLWRGAAPQLPLTLLNSVIAVCALSEDLYPGRGIQPRRVAMSVGMMNLVAVPFGGMPMCHGAGGLAAQHRFGARTGGSVILLGGMKIVAGLALGAGLVPMLQAYPRSVLAVMLIFAGAALARPARDCLRGTPLVVVAVTAGFILAWNAVAGVAAGLGVVGLVKLLGRWRGRPS